MQRIDDPESRYAPSHRGPAFAVLAQIPVNPEINRARRYCVLLNFAAPRAEVIRTLNDFGQRIEFGRCL